MATADCHFHRFKAHVGSKASRRVVRPLSPATAIVKEKKSEGGPIHVLHEAGCWAHSHLTDTQRHVSRADTLGRRGAFWRQLAWTRWNIAIHNAIQDNQWIITQCMYKYVHNADLHWHWMPHLLAVFFDLQLLVIVFPCGAQPNTMKRFRGCGVETCYIVLPWTRPTLLLRIDLSRSVK